MAIEKPKRSFARIATWLAISGLVALLLGPLAVLGLLAYFISIIFSILGLIFDEDREQAFIAFAAILLFPVLVVGIALFIASRLGE